MLVSKLLSDKRPYGHEEISIQFRDFLKDIFTDLQNSCIQCGVEKIQRICQFADPTILNSLVVTFALNRNLMDQTKIEGYSTQLEALCQRIDMVELEMENLKSHHINVVQSQKLKDTKNQSTMVGHSLIISMCEDLETSMKRGSSTSPETRYLFKSQKGYDVKENISESLFERVRFELNQIYNESIELMHQKVNDNKIEYEAEKKLYMNKFGPLFMSQKRSQPASKAVRQNSQIQIFPHSPNSLNIGKFLNSSHAFQFSEKFVQKEKIDTSGLKYQIEKQLAPLNLGINDSQFLDQKKLSSHKTRFKQPISSTTSKYSFETTSVKNIKIDQNINLDFNLVEEYEFNRSTVEFVDDEDSIRDLQSDDHQNQRNTGYLKIQQIQSQNAQSPNKKGFFLDRYNVDNPYYVCEPLSNRELIYSGHPVDFQSSYQYTGDYHNGSSSLYQDFNPSQNNKDSSSKFRKNSMETHYQAINGRKMQYFKSNNSPPNTPDKKGSFRLTFNEQEKINTDSASPNFNGQMRTNTIQYPQNYSIQKNLFGKLSAEKNLQEYLYNQEQNGLYGRPRAYSSPQSIKHTFDQTKINSLEGRSSVLSGSQEIPVRSNSGFNHPIQIIQEELSNQEPDVGESTISQQDNDTPFTVLEIQNDQNTPLYDSFDPDRSNVPPRMQGNSLYVSKSPQIKPLGNQSRIMNHRNLFPVNQFNQFSPQMFGQQAMGLNPNSNGYFGVQQQPINRFQSNFQKPQNIQFKPMYPNFSPSFQKTDFFQGNTQLPQSQIFGQIRSDQGQPKMKGQLSLLDSNGQLQMFQPTRQVMSPPPMMIYNQSYDLNNQYFGMGYNPLQNSWMPTFQDQQQINATKNYQEERSPTIARANSFQPVKSKEKVSAEIALNSKPVVNFIRIEKHHLTRKNFYDPIIFWNEESTDDYKFSQYLEQNRYQRLFKEISIIGEGGFGKVFKAQHVLDQRNYAIKKIQIHLGINQDFKMHHVYKEIVAISQVLHKNVVRYYACWIECVSAKEKHINRVCKKLEFDIKKNFKKQRSFKHKHTPISPDLLDMNKPLSSPRKLAGKRKVSSKAQISTEMIENKWRGKNLLKIIEDDGDVIMDEDWDHQKFEVNNEVETKKVSQSFSSMILSSSSSNASSSESSSSNSSSDSSDSLNSASDQEKSFIYQSKCKSKTKSIIRESSEDSFSLVEEEESEDDDNSGRSHGSLYELIEKEKNFITLNVMIQMEHCNGDTLREFLDTKDYSVNRKINYHYFKQLISGLQHIHEEGLIHRDIKPANIFIDKARMSLKIGDFGLAKQNNVQQELAEEIKGLKRQQWSLADLQQYNNITTIQSKDHLVKKQLKAQLAGCNQVSVEVQQHPFTPGRPNRECSQTFHEELEASICAGTPMYQAPEQTMHQIQILKKANEPICLTDKVDMFAAGLILYELCSNFKTQHQRIQKFSQLRSQRDLDEELFKKMPEERDIILNLTDPDPKKRSSAIYLLNSKTFQSWSFESKQ